MLSPSPTAPTLRVGLYRTSSIGDVVLATACLDLLDQLGMPVEVTWLGRQPSLGLIKAAFAPERLQGPSRATGLVSVDCVDVPRTTEGVTALLQTAQHLANLHLMVDLQTNLRSRLFCKGLTRVHGTPIFSCDKEPLRRSRLVMEAWWRGRRRPLPDEVHRAGLPQAQMMAETLRRALEFQLPVELLDTIRHYTPRPRLPMHDTDLSRPWQKELHYGRWLAVAPGAAHAPKQAPVEIMQEIVDLTQKQFGTSRGDGKLGLLFVGDERDRETARQLLDGIVWQGPVLNLAGRLSLWETALALASVDALLTNDSALSHVAEAVDTPTSVLFGPTVEAFGFAPRLSASHAFSVALGCRPCSKHGKKTCRYGDSLCFRSQPMNEIAQHLAALVAREEKDLA